MPRFIVLLRAVNVGGTGKLPMADLRRSLTDAGYSNVSTLLASGNVVLDAAQRSTASLEKKLEAHLAERHGLATDVIVRTPAEWRSLIDANPMPGETKAAPSCFYAMVMKTSPDAGAADYLDAYPGPERTVLADRIAYMHFPDGMGRSKFNPDRLGLGTSRNWNTVTKLAEAAGA